jgi:hypothetical protein
MAGTSCDEVYNRLQHYINKSTPIESISDIHDKPMVIINREQLTTQFNGNIDGKMLPIFEITQMPLEIGENSKHKGGGNRKSVATGELSIAFKNAMKQYRVSPTLKHHGEPVQVKVINGKVHFYKFTTDKTGLTEYNRNDKTAWCFTTITEYGIRVVIPKIQNGIRGFEIGYCRIEDIPDGSYEVCGPKIQGNAYAFENHVLVRHGLFDIQPEDLPELTLPALAQFCAEYEVEGIVFHFDNCQMFKVNYGHVKEYIKMNKLIPSKRCGHEYRLNLDM